MYRILIAEDEERIAQLLDKGLRRQGFAATVARNGGEVLALVKQGAYDLLLLDLGLPDIDGMEVLRELRATARDLPVIILSARTDERDIAAGYAGGAREYVTKPFKFSDLIAKIDKIRQP
ncbi:MAG: response regulator [Cyanobacteria bacterium J06641_5]